MRRLLPLPVLLLALPAFAQDLESIGGLRVRFDAPGARTAAMGGASEAVSDAFSVATNPAGLAHQTNRLVAVEARETGSETDFLTGGTVGAFTSSSFDTTSRGLRGAVVVLPTAFANFALSYDEPLHVSQNTGFLRPTTTDEAAAPFGVGWRNNELVPIESCTNPNGPSYCTFISFYSSPAIMPVVADVTMRRYSLAAARSVGRLALGASAHYATVRQEVEAFGTTQNAHDRQLTWNAGAQVDLTKTIRFGASYRSGAEFAGARVTRFLAEEPVKFTYNYNTPSSFAAGLAADITPSLTVAFDAVRVNYSEMTPDPYPELAPRADRFAMPDVTELRAGAEYRLSTRVPVTLRAGWWLEPMHRVQASGGFFPGLSDVTNAVMFRDEDENHVTAGIGIGDRVRFDAAVDRSENTTRASVGLATTF